jgi:hypothetical protein
MSGKGSSKLLPSRVHRRHQAGIDGCRRSRSSAAAGRQAGRQAGRKSVRREDRRGRRRRREKKKLHETELETLMVGCTWQRKRDPVEIITVLFS